VLTLDLIDQRSGKANRAAHAPEVRFVNRFVTPGFLRVGISGLSAALSRGRYFHTVHSFFHFRYFSSSDPHRALRHGANQPANIGAVCCCLISFNVLETRSRRRQPQQHTQWM